MTFGTRKSHGLAALRGSILAATLALLPMAAIAQDAVVIDQAALDAVLAECVSAEACDVAIQTLIAEIAAANPNVPVASIVGAVASAVSEAYNEGTVPAAVASVALTSTVSVARDLGVSEAAVAAIEVAVAATEAGEPVNVEAVTEATASPN